MKWTLLKTLLKTLLSLYYAMSIGVCIPIILRNLYIFYLYLRGLTQAKNRLNDWRTHGRNAILYNKIASCPVYLAVMPREGKQPPSPGDTTHTPYRV